MTKFAPTTPDGYIVLERFHGFVLSVDRDAFWIRCTDQIGDGEMFPALEAEIETIRLPDEELPYLTEGAYFTWEISQDPEHSSKCSLMFTFDKSKVTSEELAQSQTEVTDLLQRIKFE